MEKPAPLRRPKPHYQVGLKENISLIKRITPIFAFIAKLCPIFEICDDLLPRKSKMAALGGHLGIQKLAISLQWKQISGWSIFKTISALLALISYVIVILVGRTCLAVEEKMHMLISTFTKKNHFCTLSYESRFFIFTQFWGDNVIERGTC